MLRTNVTLFSTHTVRAGTGCRQEHARGPLRVGRCAARTLRGATCAFQWQVRRAAARACQMARPTRSRRPRGRNTDTNKHWQLDCKCGCQSVGPNLVNYVHTKRTSGKLRATLTAALVVIGSGVPRDR